MVSALEKRPEICCRHLLSKIQALESFDAAARKRALDRFSENALQAIRQASADQWLPVEYNIELSESVAAEIGEEGLYAWGLKALNYSINSSMISPFIRAALSVFKIGPSTFIKVSPHLWKSIYRNCGELSVVEDGINAAQVLLNGLPPVMVNSRILIVTIAAFIQALFSFSGVKGRTMVERISTETGSATITASWDLV
jgi:hypothetical protein